MSAHPTKILIIGSGGHARVLQEAIASNGRKVEALTDIDPDKWGLEINGAKIIGADSEIEKLKPDSVELVNGLGSVDQASIDSREAIFLKFKALGYHFLTVVHATAIVATDVTLGEGAQILAGANLRPGTSIGENCIINTGAIIDHDCVIGPHSHIAPGAVLSGNVIASKKVHIGVAATIIQGIRIGEGALLGAGSVAIKDIEKMTVEVGSPARKIRS